MTTTITAAAAQLLAALEQVRLHFGISGADLEHAAHIFTTCQQADLAISHRDALLVSTALTEHDRRGGEAGSVTPASSDTWALRARFRQAEQIVAGELEIVDLGNGVRVAQPVRH